MPSFDGADFVRIDDQATGDGTNNTTRPLDTMLEHAVRSNTQNVRQNRGQGISWTPNRDRIWFSLQWSTIHWCMYPLKASTKSLDSYILHEIQDPPNIEDIPNPLQIGLRLKAVGAAGQGSTFAQETTSINLSGLAQSRISLDFDKDDIVRQRWVVLMWQIRYFFQDDSDYNTIKELPSFTANIPDSYRRAHVTSSRVLPNIETELDPGPTGAMLFFPYDGENPSDADYAAGAQFSMELQSQFREGASGKAGIWSSPDAYQYKNDINLNQTNAIRVVNFAELHISAIHLQESHYDDNNITSRNIAGDRPYEAQQSSFRQARALTETYEEVRPISMGWGGDVRSTSEWGDQPTMFGYHYGDPQADDPDNLRGTCKVDFESTDDSGTRLEFRFLTLAAFLRDDIYDGQDSSYDVSALKEDAGFIEFNLTVDVEGVGGTTIGSATQGFNVDLFPTDATGRFPTLQMLKFSNFGDDDKTPSIGDQFTDGHEIHTYHEGEVRERELSLWTPQQMQVPVGQFNRSNQLRWSFDAGITDRNARVAVDKEQLVIAFSGVSIFERPQ